MGWLCPLSIFPGILFPQIFGPLNTIAPALFAIMAFQGALSNHFRQVAEVFRPPVLIAIIFLVGDVVYPVIGYLIASSLFGTDPALLSGMVLLCAAPTGTTCMIWVGLYGGNMALGLTATLLTSFLAPFTIPLTLQLLVGATVEIDALPMMMQLLFMVVIPAIAGMAVTERTHGWGEEVLAPKLAPVAFALMLVINMANASTLAPMMANLNLMDLGVIVVMFFVTVGFYLFGLAIARVLRRDRRDTIAMSFAIGQKNTSAASTLASTYLPAGANLPIMSALLYAATIAAVIGSRVGEPDTETPEFETVEREAESRMSERSRTPERSRMPEPTSARAAMSDSANARTLEPNRLKERTASARRSRASERTGFMSLQH